MYAQELHHGSGNRIIECFQLRLFVLNCLEKVACSAAHAQQLADILICSDYRGHYSHGLNRLHIYVNDLAEKSTLSDGEPLIIKQKGATAWVDGCNLLGPVVGNFCMKLAIQKARTHGIGWVVAKNSNHFGIAGWYAESALQQGLVGMAFTNTSPCVFPTNSAEKSLGSNPICLAAPAANGDSFFLDMASTTVAYGKIDPSYPVQVAGDPERAHMYMCDELDGIVYKKSQLEHLYAKACAGFKWNGSYNKCECNGAKWADS
ncbi:malate/L-lactate dehydrogenase [Teladorsagia circumcincta]|uniref:Malate/L-lactate dehydrogenase n=1 Tax=Teladorsagia circumcincta TaxID=45464 RepID=A0A2G9UU80_TELCI|nr:malate/L-lactate dehydrogenase [Teladorsagia circumcincta]